MNVCYAWVCAIFFVAFSIPDAYAQNVHGVLRVVKGDVQIKSGKNGQQSRARVGAKVFPKDTVITGKDSRAKIVMIDNNEINVSPDSQIEIQHYEYNPSANKKDVLLNVIYGKVRSKVEQKYDGTKSSKFQIKTPSAVAGVRGTDFMVGFQNNQSQVVTFSGKVEFGLPGPGGTIANPVIVTPGMSATNSPGSAPTPPAPVPKEQLNSLDSETQADAPTGGSNTQNTASNTQDDSGKKEEGGAKNEQSGAPDKQAGTGGANEGESGGTGSSGGGGEGQSAGTGGPGGAGGAGGSSGGEGGRSPANAPASESACTMCNVPDAGPGTGAMPKPPEPPAPVPVLPPIGGVIPVCGDGCRSGIEQGNSRLIIHVNTQ